MGKRDFAWWKVVGTWLPLVGVPVMDGWEFTKRECTEEWWSPFAWTLGCTARDRGPHSRFEIQTITFARVFLLITNFEFQ